MQHQPIKAELLKAVEKVLEHGKFILGAEVIELENKFAEYCGARYAIGVDNGTSALCLAMQALGIGIDDEVITVPNPFLASASSIALVGAKPVFVDVGEDLNMDAAKLESAITPQTKAILPVHLTGRPANMAPIQEIAQRHGIDIIEDCAQAVGARYHDKHVGTFGIIGCFSLHPMKTLNAIGDGGMIITNDEAVARFLRKARNHGFADRDHCEFWSH
ncbi:DegT/DnrJ/EryC1/StrS family aminotransferase, partial [bacterium]